MRHMGTGVLETRRLILRPFTVEDAPAMYRNWASDPEVTRFLTWLPHADESVTLEVCAFWASRYAERTFYQWAVVLRDLGEPIGSIGVVGRNEPIDAVEMGYCLGRPWWGRGLMAEALGEVIGFFFREAGANRVEADHDVENPNSGRVMEKCGMRYEGTRRQGARNNRGLRDAACYAILREDWER